MKEELYKNLTTDEKIGFLHYIRGKQGIVQHEYYEGTDNNPNMKLDPEDVYISNVLNLNWKDIKSSDLIDTLCKKHNEDLSSYKFDSECGPMWHIVDIIGMIVFSNLSITENKTIDVELMESLDIKIKKAYQFFLGLEKTKETYIYIQSPITCDGEQLYRRVKNE